MPNIIALVSQYELLNTVASYISAVDLLNFASTCSVLHSLVRKNDSVFTRLKRLNICDGRGLTVRQDFKRLHSIPADFERPWNQVTSVYDEEVEVRVWNLKCDSVNALPCIKCNVNICEECRFVPRVREMYNDRSRRKPHIDSEGNCIQIRCYCKECDVKIESDLPPRISPFCDCDQYTRWICMKCRDEEEALDLLYLKHKTKSEEQYEGYPDESARESDPGMWRFDSQDSLAFWCPCGKRAPSDGNVRCAWCLRRHRDTQIYEGDSIPCFDDDPCYPPEADQYRIRDNRAIYPPLAYSTVGLIAP